MTDDPGFTGPLGWLPDSQLAHATGVEAWRPFEDRLQRLLEDLAEDQFVICNLQPRAIDGREPSRKYLQYLLTTGNDGRRLIAEASSLRYQGGLDPNALAQEALIDAMGWARLDSDNHLRNYQWPSGIQDAVSDSLRILRDIWRVAHPSQLTFQDVGTLGGGPLTDGLTLPDIKDSLELWIESSGWQARRFEDDPDEGLIATTNEGSVLIFLQPNGTRIDLVSFVASIRWEPWVTSCILDIAAEAFISGCPIAPGDGSDRDLYLRDMLPVNGLNEHIFMAQVRRNLDSRLILATRLGESGALAGQPE